MLSLQKRAPASNLGGSPKSKKRNSGKHISAPLIPDTIEWPLLDILWQTIGDPASELYLKSQPSFDDYGLAAKRFFACLSLVVRGLHQDQIMVVF